MSLRVGLTGGLAVGKSTVAEMFASQGAYVMYADRVGHDAMQPGERAYQEIIQRFGQSILNADRTIDRKKLAGIAFGENRIEELNKIIHPAVRESMERWMKETVEFDPRALLIFEAALILEAGLGKYFDKLVVVTSSPEQKIERFAKRMMSPDASDEERRQALRDAEKRMGAQLSDAEKMAAADFIIDNSGTLADTERQVVRVAKELQKQAAMQSNARAL
ncbi:MAG: dephospho-CoA kinase [Acidobacteria bacterium]|nr:dephospho-CoA kinase [Acidobacteriota bacterium]MBV9148033.1 dephospho-CoA kinase [Acidobacteriota bacterium]MBV9435664.1 dephospho-CoA kinase [Acidobacteriota bacterium]